MRDAEDGEELPVRHEVLGGNQGGGRQNHQSQQAEPARGILSVEPVVATPDERQQGQRGGVLDGGRYPAVERPQVVVLLQEEIGKDRPREKAKTKSGEAQHHGLQSADPLQPLERRLDRYGSRMIIGEDLAKHRTFLLATSHRLGQPEGDAGGDGHRHHHDEEGPAPT